MKKIISMLTAAVMLFAALSGSVFAEFNDVTDDNPYKSAITTLNTLSVIDGYEDGTFKPDGVIKRSEFTKLVVFLLGLQDITYSSYTLSDVEASYWASNYIQTGYDRGIITGFDDGTFRPEEPVTYAQALKMVVCMLGYETYALERSATTDGWADKYIQEANQLGITKSISGIGFYDNAPRGIVAQILYNALEVQMNENNGYKWTTTEKTLLNDYLKVKKIKGTLVGVDDYTTEDCTVSLPENHIDILTNAGDEVLIDYSTYTTKVTDMNKHLGSTLTVYYRQISDNDDRKLVGIDAETTKNYSVEINSEDLSSFKDGSLKYYDSTTSKLKTVKLKDDITVRYNGKLVTANETVDVNGTSCTRAEALEKWLDSESGSTVYGTVKLTDNGGDNVYDMVQIYNYKMIVALSAPSSTDYRITNKLVTGDYMILDPQASNYTYTITKDNEEIPVTSIAANDVVLYAWSLDGELCTLLVSNKTVTGKIDSMSTEDSQMTINNTVYNISGTCNKYIQEKSGKELKVGVSGTFYLDAFDSAVFGTIQEVAAAPYAYITNAFFEDGKQYITVYTPSSGGEPSSYALKSTVKINGASTKSESALSKIQYAASYVDKETESELANEIYGAGKTPANATYAQPARVKIANNEVTEIVLLNSSEVQSQNEDKEKIVRCKSLNEYGYSNNGFTLNGSTSFSVNSSTLVVYVPADRDNRKGYAKKAPSAAFTSGEKYYLEAYDINSSRIAGLIILYGADGSLTKVKKDTDFSVVGKLPQKEFDSAKGEIVQSLELYTGSANTTKKWHTYSDSEFSDVRVGDVIQFNYDSDNLIQNRINNIKFRDVAKVLDEGAQAVSDGSGASEIFNWYVEQTPTDENNHQDLLFDYRFKTELKDKNGNTVMDDDGNPVYVDETYGSTVYDSVPNSRAAVFNVSQVLTDEKKLHVTQSPFVWDEAENKYVLDDNNYEEITISSSTKILRMESKRDELSRYVEDTTSDLTINDLRDAKNYGTDCSKILVLLSKNNTKMILIYN